MRLVQLLSRLKFYNPPKNKIAILYSDDYWLRNLVLKELPSTTLELYPETIHVTPSLVLRTALRLHYVRMPRAGEKSRIKHLLRQIYAQYILACIDQIGAEVVLTFIDNSAFFHRLSRLDGQRTYFAIQNGTRTLTSVRDSLVPPHHPTSVISMTNFFCFGQRDIDLFNRFGHEIDAYYPVGSLIGGYYKSAVSVPVAEPQFDLCYVSQWHGHLFEDVEFGDDFLARERKWVRTDIEGVNSFLRRLLDETDLRLVVCPRNDGDAAEVSFFRQIFGDRATISESDRRDFSTYRMIERSRLTIALNSTPLLEALAWGQKVLWCNVYDDEHVEMPEAGISYFHGADYEAFKQRVSTLLAMPQEEYEELTREGARYINNYDPDCPPHEAIRAAVLKSCLRSPR